MNAVSPLAVLVVGFSGGRGRLYAECVAERDGLSLEGIVKNSREPDLSGFSTKPKVYDDLTNALEDRQWDAAIVSVPHGSHHMITRALIQSGVGLIIKEKPLATNYEQAKEYSKLIEDRKITIVTTTQRMVQPSFLRGLDMLPLIGELHNFEYLYHFALPQMTTGWRANRELAIGGVLLDMGYHALDVLHLYFGSMTEIGGRLSYEHNAMAEQQLEDRAEIELSFANVKGSLSIDRHASRKQEVFKITGSKGTLEIRPTETILYDNQGKETERHTGLVLSKQEQINLLFDRCLKSEHANWRQQAFSRNMNTVAAIDQIYKRSSHHNEKVACCTL